jgi:branched-chain amino acid transport system permease protein
MTGLLQAVVSGALTGLVYGIVALSFVVIYRASRIVNLAQGQLVLIGAFFVWTFVQQLGLPPAVGLPLAILASMAAGALTERLVFRQLIGQSTFAMVMASIGLLILLQGLTQIVWGAETRSFPRIFPDGAINLGEVYVNKALLIGAAITLALVEAMHWFFMQTTAGLRMAAVAEDHVTALSLGVSVKAAARIAWVLGAALAVLAATILLSGTVLGLQAAEIGLRALPVALLGGLESVRGASLAGVIVGIGEALASKYLDGYTQGAASQVFVSLLMIAVLLVRPQGMFGWRAIERI